MQALHVVTIEKPLLIELVKVPIGNKVKAADCHSESEIDFFQLFNRLNQYQLHCDIKPISNLFGQTLWNVKNYRTRFS